MLAPFCDRTKKIAESAWQAGQHLLAETPQMDHPESTPEAPGSISTAGLLQRHAKQCGAVHRAVPRMM